MIIASSNKRYQLVRLRGVRTRMLLGVQAQRSNVHETTKLKVNSNDLDPGLEPRIHACHQTYQTRTAQNDKVTSRVQSVQGQVH